MVKIQLIEKLFLHILTYSYLLLPIFFIYSRSKRANELLIALYGIFFFILLFTYIYSFIPSRYLNLYQTFYTFFEYIFFTAFLWVNIFYKKFRVLIVFFSLLFIAYQLVDYFSKMYNSVPMLDSIPIGIETILIFLYISGFFFQNFQTTSNEYIYNHPCFWMSIGMLIYLGGSFFFNILVNHIDRNQVDRYWYLTSIADILKNLFFCISIIVYVRTPRKEKSLHKSVPYLDLDIK